MIREFNYRGRQVVIDDTPVPPKPAAPPEPHDHADGHHHHPPPPPDHGGHGGHGNIRIRIDDKTIFADRVTSGYYFMTHEFPFQDFTTIEDLVKAVIDHGPSEAHHGVAEKPK